MGLCSWPALLASTIVFVSWGEGGIPSTENGPAPEVGMIKAFIIDDNYITAR